MRGNVETLTYITSPECCMSTVTPPPLFFSVMYKQDCSREIAGAREDKVITFKSERDTMMSQGLWEQLLRWFCD